MAYVTVETSEGPKQLRVCDYCKTACVTSSQRYCSGRCSRMANGYNNALWGRKDKSMTPPETKEK